MPDVAVLDLGRAESEGKASMGLPACRQDLAVLDLGRGESEGKASMRLPACRQDLEKTVRYVRANRPPD